MTLQRTAWAELDAAGQAAWVAGLRPPAPDADVAPIVADIRDRGDAALRELTARFDGADLASPWLDVSEIEAPAVPAELDEALRRAAAAIRRWRVPMPGCSRSTSRPGGRCRRSGAASPRPARAGTHDPDRDRRRPVHARGHV